MMSERTVRAASRAGPEISHPSETTTTSSDPTQERTFNAFNKAYPFPADEAEWERLDKKHAGDWILFDGLTPCPDVIDAVLRSDVGSPKRIMDAGCGSGSWAIEMARLYPRAEVIGIDLAPRPQDPGHLPSNVRFETYDLNRGLSHLYGQFDVTHARSITGGITDPTVTFNELIMCLKPGGVALIIEGDRDYWDEKGQKVLMAKVDGDEDVEGVGEEGSWTQRIIWEVVEASIMAGSHHLPAFTFIDGGLWDSPLCDPETAGAGVGFIPFGPWAEGSTAQETDLLQTAGRLIRDIFTVGHRSFQIPLARNGLSQEVTDKWVERAQEEMDTLKFRMSLRYRFCWARRRAGEGLPAPPLSNFQPTPLVNNPAPMQILTPASGGESKRPAHVRYPAIEFYYTPEEANRANQRRMSTIKTLPTAAVRRASQLKEGRWRKNGIL